MTSFDALETSQQGSRPLELYRFALGSDLYLFTSAEDAITIVGDTYEPESVSRSEILGGQDDTDTALTVTLPTSNDFAQLFRLVPPASQATLTVYRLQRDEVPTFATRLVIFKGFVTEVSFPGDGTQAQVSAVSLAANNGHQMPRFVYSTQCNHVLYDAGCGVNSALFSHTGTVTAVSGNVITVSGASGFPVDFFRSGYAFPSFYFDRRQIIAHSGNNLTLFVPFSRSVLNQSVTIRAGCNRQLNGDCITKFNNGPRFGGFHFVPVRNPNLHKIV